MANNRADSADVVTPVESEEDTLTVQPITAEDNDRLTDVRSGNSQELRESGVLPDLSIAHDFAYVYENFDNLDQSKDGHITKEEIDAFIKSGSELQPEDTAVLTQIRDQSKRIEELFDDEVGDENNGFTRGDLRTASENANAMDFAQRNFYRLDGNHDGNVTGSELDIYAHARGELLSAEDLDNIKVLKKNMSDFEEFSNDESGDENSGFTRRDLIKGKKEQGIDSVSIGASDGETPSPFGDLRPALTYVQENYEKIDANLDGYISEDEINLYGDSNELSLEEMQNLRALKARVHNVAEQSGDSSVDKNGISREDIKAANEQIANLVYAQEIFDKVDANGDKHVTAEEIEGHITAMGYNLPANELRRMEALKKQVGDLQEKHNDENFDENNGFTLHDLTDALDELGSAGIGDVEPGSEVPQASDEVPPEEPVDEQSQNAEEVNPEPDEGEKTHTVERGDSLWKICKQELRQRLGGSQPTNAEILEMVNEMARLNNLADPNLIRPGDILRVPGSTQDSESELEVPPLVII